MELKLDSDNFKDLFSAAIMQALDQQKKEELIGQALKYLISKTESNRYGSNFSPLETAFQYALQEKAREVAKEFLNNNQEIKIQIESLITDAVKKITTDSRENTVNKIAEKIVEGIYSYKY